MPHPLENSELIGMICLRSDEIYRSSSFEGFCRSKMGFTLGKFYTLLHVPGLQSG